MTLRINSQSLLVNINMNENLKRFESLPIIKASSIPDWELIGETDAPLNTDQLDLLDRRINHADQSSKKWMRKYGIEYTEKTKKINKKESKTRKQQKKRQEQNSQQPPDQPKRSLILPPEHLNLCRLKTIDQREKELLASAMAGAMLRNNSDPSSLPRNYQLAKMEDLLDVPITSAPESVITYIIENLFKKTSKASKASLEIYSQFEIAHGIKHSNHSSYYDSKIVALEKMALDCAIIYNYKTTRSNGKVFPMQLIIDLEIDGRSHKFKNDWDGIRDTYLQQTLTNQHTIDDELPNLSEDNDNPGDSKASVEFQVLRVVWNPERDLKDVYLPFEDEGEIQSLMSLELEMYVWKTLIPQIYNSLKKIEPDLSNFVDRKWYLENLINKSEYIANRVASECIEQIRGKLNQIIFALQNPYASKRDLPLQIHMANSLVYSYLTDRDVRRYVRSNRPYATNLFWFLDSKIYNILNDYYAYCNQIAPRNKFKDDIAFKDFVFNTLAMSFRSIET